MNQVFANFTITDREVLRFQKAELEQAGDDPPRIEQREWAKISVYLRRETDDRFDFVGNINYVDREGIDRETGTLGLRAIFENPYESLLPGLFVHVRVPFRREGTVILVPLSAVIKRLESRAT